MIDNSYLLGLFGSSSTGTTSYGSALSSAASRKKQPTAPWSTSSSAMPEASQLVRAALGGRKIINDSDVDIDVKGASADYKKLFALYQGLETLTQLANRASVKGVSATEAALLAKRFTSGLGEVGDYLTDNALEGVRLVQGVSSSVSKSTAGVAKDKPNYVTDAIHEGATNTVVAAFAGDVAFSIDIKRLDGKGGKIDIDLADMGTKPRTLDNVIKHINTQLEAAGVETRFGRQKLASEPKTLTVNGKTVTLPSGADRWALVVEGDSAETVTFSSKTTQDAVYVTQTTGSGAGQLLKFQSDVSTAAQTAASTFFVDGEVDEDALPDNVTGTRATVEGPDGTIWVVADLAADPDNPPADGEGEVALMQFDAAGKLLVSQIMGVVPTTDTFDLAVDGGGEVSVNGNPVTIDEGSIVATPTAPLTSVAGVGETFWVDGRVDQSALPDYISTVRASATGPDGSVWIVGDMNGDSTSQPIKGVSDVALMKFDAAGNLLFTRALGAASTASGYALAVNTDGSVAVAGSVTGALDKGVSGTVATVADSFVTVFDSAGLEQWTQRRGARAEDEATAVSFGADGIVYVAGRAKSAMPGAAAVGGWDSYLESFSAAAPYPTAAVTAKTLSTTQFGTTGDDSVGAMTVDGNNLYTAGIENNRMVVRRFTLDANGKPTLQSTRDLGYASGEIAGVSVVDGQVVVSGTTRNSALNVATVTNAHAGGTDAFVATLNGNLQASSAERLTYFGGAGDDTAADVKVVNGKVWLTGVSNRALDAEEEDPTQGYLARINPTTGAVEWSRTWSGDAQQATPSTLAVVSDGASVLDRLGLPTGTVVQKDSRLLTAGTAVRAGDRFTVSPADGGRAVTVTIDAKDTLATLAAKIERASNRKLKVSVTTDSSVNPPVQRLSIMARDGKTGAILSAGEPGRDALAGLGLTPGYIGMSSGDTTTKTFGLNLPKTLSLADADSIKAAGEALQAAMKSIRDAYRALAPTTTTTGASSSVSGEVPAYLSAKLANYQAALSRLNGGS